jgi:hypothetical protein
MATTASPPSALIGLILARFGDQPIPSGQLARIGEALETLKPSKTRRSWRSLFSLT